MLDANKTLNDTRSYMQKAIDHLEVELAKIRAGCANPTMLDSVHVDYYGTATPLNQVANVSAPEARTLVIQPWKRGMGPIEKAILGANLGFSFRNDGTVVGSTSRR